MAVSMRGPDIVSEMTYNVSSGTLNTTIPYHTIRGPDGLMKLLHK